MPAVTSHTVVARDVEVMLFDHDVIGVDAEPVLAEVTHVELELVGTYLVGAAGPEVDVDDAVPVEEPPGEMIGLDIRATFPRLDDGLTVGRLAEARPGDPTGVARDERKETDSVFESCNLTLTAGSRNELGVPVG